MERDILQNRYERLINQEDINAFSSLLDDYIDFISENEKCSAIIADMQKQKDELLEEKLKLKDKVLSELEDAKNIDSEVKKIVGVNSERKNSEEFENNFYYLVNKYFSESYSKLSALEKKITKKQKLWDAWDGIKSEKYNINGCKQYVEKIQAYLFEKLSIPNVVVKKADIENNTSVDLVKNKENDPFQIESILIITKYPGNHKEKVWLVFNNDFNHDVEFSTEGKHGMHSYIKTLCEVAEKYNQVRYDSQIASSINSKIFERSVIKGRYKQKTIVKKDGGYFRINNDIAIRTIAKVNLTKEQLKYLSS
ncbi:MAG: hypothetical protein Q7U36_04320 [bacterium]|nr:hypothetical protein [bacterium]